MFRPDPNGEHSVEEVIAKLRDALTDEPPDSPRARKLAELIRGLRDRTNEDAAAGTGAWSH
jgi:hypothetical protein